MDSLLACALFVAGLAFGSFLNVCISRIPRDLSIVTPPSYCPRCEARIRWRDNVPLLSWVLLRGRCRTCGAAISWRYPAVELLTAALFVASYACCGFTWLGLRACVFCFLLVGLIFMDAETGLLPHEFTYTGVLAGLASAWLAPFDPSGTLFLLRVSGLRNVTPGPELWLADAALAAAIGAGFFYFAWALYYLVRKRDGVGFGDVALMGMVGAFLGLKLTLLVMFVAPLFATLVAFGLLFGSRGAWPFAPATATPGSAASDSFLARALPFGVFLGGSALIALFCGARIWTWYLEMFR